MDPTNPNRPPWEDETQPVPPPSSLPPSSAAPMPGSAAPAEPIAAAPPPGSVPPEPAPSPGAWPPGPPPEYRGPAPTPAARPGDNQGALVLGILLVLLGAAFLVSRVIDLEIAGETWPLWIIAVGVALLVASVLVRSHAGLGLAIPGGIVTMLGIVLAVQAWYDLYETWAYAWALVAPGGVGVGMLVHGLASRDPETRANGLNTLLVGLGLFVGFGLFFEGVVKLSGDRIPGLEDALPFVVIALGALLVALSLLGTGTRRAR